MSNWPCTDAHHNVQFLGTMRRSPGSAADNACGLSVVECIIVSVLRRRASIKPAPAGVCVCESGCRCWWPSRSTESTPLGGSGSTASTAPAHRRNSTKLVACCYCPPFPRTVHIPVPSPWQRRTSALAAHPPTAQLTLCISIHRNRPQQPQYIIRKTI